MYRILFLALVSSLALMVANQAVANSRFTVINNLDIRVRVDIYNGGDAVCDFTSKQKNVAAGESENFGCKGQGKHRCKIHVKTVWDNAGRACKNLYNTCEDYSIKVRDGATIEINDDGHTCTLTD